MAYRTVRPRGGWKGCLVCCLADACAMMGECMVVPVQLKVAVQTMMDRLAQNPDEKVAHNRSVDNVLKLCQKFWDRFHPSPAPAPAPSASSNGDQRQVIDLSNESPPRPPKSVAPLTPKIKREGSILEEMDYMPPLIAPIHPEPRGANLNLVHASRWDRYGAGSVSCGPHWRMWRSVPHPVLAFAFPSGSARTSRG